MARSPHQDRHGGTLLSETQAEHQVEQESKQAQQAVQSLVAFIDECQQIGDLIGIDFGVADALVHDALKQKAGGVPHGCFLLATRLGPQAKTEPDDPETSLLLLRVIGRSPLPNDIETQQARLEAGQRASDTAHTWDQRPHTDQFTLHQMRYAGIRCRILGTFRLHRMFDGDWQLDFGADIDNYYAGQGMKIYKPVGDALQYIANFTRDRHGDLAKVEVGRLRYAAAIKDPRAPEAVPIRFATQDLVARRTALFGMTRTGKSNTTKTMAKALFQLRLPDEPNPLRVGQLILDPNGEYANENPQDQGCLKNVRHLHPSAAQDVVTYGLVEHPYDEGRKITKFDFFGHRVTNWNQRAELDARLQTLYQGKDIINELLRGETAAYIQNFVRTDMTAPAAVEDSERGPAIRYRRSVFAYQAILVRAGFPPPNTAGCSIKGLFSKSFRDLLKDNPDPDVKHWSDRLANDVLPWDEASDWCAQLSHFVRTDAFKAFDREYAQQKAAAGQEARKWSDERLLGLLSIFEHTRGLRLMGEARNWHQGGQTRDYVDDIVAELRAGRLVIVDQALGDPDMNRIAAERILERIFNRQKQDFIRPQWDENGRLKPIPPVVIYAEEAHTLLPRGADPDVRNIWARVAKEGAKFALGLVYSTQEPSSIQTNILKNTENWFIAHLNNTDELREVRKYNDFEDFAESILRVAEPGFLRMRTLSSPYTIPVQVHPFTAPPPNSQENGDLAVSG